MKTETINKIIEEIKHELLDKVDEYFPKIKPQGRNEGRGEAAVIVGIALARFTEALEKAIQEATQFTEDELDVIAIDFKSITEVGMMIKRQVSGNPPMDLMNALSQRDKIELQIYEKLKPRLDTLSVEEI